MRVTTYEEAVALGLGDVWRREMSGDQPSGLKARKESKSSGIVVPPAASKAGGMNKTEANFARLLDRMRESNSVLCWEFEPEKFRIAERCWLKIDFRVILPSHQVIFVETKGGFIREDAMIKLKAVAEIHPYAFFLAQYQERVWTIRRMPSRRWGGIDASVDWDI